VSKLQKPVSVLIVEDDTLLRMDAAAFFEDAGYTVHEAANADEAIRLLEQNSNIRLVFTDVQMPGSIDGLKLARYVRERWPPVKIIIASGQVCLRQDELPSGSAFFSKPYRPEQITGKFQEMLAEAA
jgi:CheY-like chemotaxis protein